MDTGETRWQQAITRHGHPNARLTDLKDQEDAGDRDDGAQRHDAGHPLQIVFSKHERQWIGDAELAIRHHAGQHQRDDNVEDRADDECQDRSPRQVALGVLAFFSGC